MTLHFADIPVTARKNLAYIRIRPRLHGIIQVMLRALAALILLLLSACGLVRGFKRPKYTGPLQKPLWQVDDILVNQVFIGNRIVYCRARTFASSEMRLYAFSSENGARLWVSDFEPAPGWNHFFAGDFLVVRTTDNRSVVLDSKSGKPAADAPAQLAKAMRGDSRDGITYLVGPGRLSAISKTELWHADLPIDVADGPVITADTVYVAGPTDQTKALYAFDRKTGAMKWKWSFSGYGSSIAADEDAVYAYVTGDSRSVVAIDAVKGVLKWSKPISSTNITESPVLLGSGSLLIRDNPPGRQAQASETGYVLRTLKRSTGETEREVTTAWKYPDWILAGPGMLFASDKSAGPLLNEGGDAAPESWVTGVGLPDGKEIWRTASVPYGILTPLAFGSGIVTVGISPYSAPVPKPGDPMPAGLWVFRSP
jgi:outer membrane protein assembly factor BamB